MVRKPHEMSVVRRTAASQPSPKRPVIERGDRERERDREPDVARVEERRMDRDERMVLQQRIRARAVERHRARLRLERVRGEEHQREEEQQHRVLHERRPRDERIGRHRSRNRHVVTAT